MWPLAQDCGKQQNYVKYEWKQAGKQKIQLIMILLYLPRGSTNLNKVYTVVAQVKTVFRLVRERGWGWHVCCFAICTYSLYVHKWHSRFNKTYQHISTHLPEKMHRILTFCCSTAMTEDAKEGVMAGEDRLTPPGTIHIHKETSMRTWLCPPKDVQITEFGCFRNNNYYYYCMYTIFKIVRSSKFGVRWMNTY